MGKVSVFFILPPSEKWMINNLIYFEWIPGKTCSRNEMTTFSCRKREKLKPWSFAALCILSLKYLWQGFIIFYDWRCFWSDYLNKSGFLVIQHSLKCTPEHAVAQSLRTPDFQRPTFKDNVQSRLKILRSNHVDEQIFRKTQEIVFDLFCSNILSIERHRIFLEAELEIQTTDLL